MKWDILKRRCARELCWRVGQATSLPTGEAAKAVAKLLRDCLDGYPIPDQIGRHLEANGRFDAAVVEAAKDEICRRLDSWDIRAVGRLRDLIPEAFPRSLRNCTLVCLMDEEGCWCVVPGRAAEQPVPGSVAESVPPEPEPLTEIPGVVAGLQPDLTQLSSHDWIQIRMAADGCVSGRLYEWPHLGAAFERIGIARTPAMHSETMRDVCRLVMALGRAQQNPHACAQPEN